MATHRPDIPLHTNNQRDASLTLSSSSAQEDADEKISHYSTSTKKFSLEDKGLPSTNHNSGPGYHPSAWLPAYDGSATWDLIVVLCALITATFSVFIFSFYGFITPWAYPVYFVIERLLDTVFIAELFRNVWNTVQLFKQSNEKNQFRRKNSFRRYIGVIWWLVVDVLSAIPWDLIALTLNSSNPSQRPLQVVRFLRMLHLFKLVRIMKMLRLNGTKFRYLEVNLGLKLAHYQLIRLITAILLLSHICGCLFYFFGTVSKPETSWVEAALTGGDLPDNVYGKYIASLYFSVYTITTIGYGDITPESSTERTYTTIIMLLGAAFFAFTISQGHDISSKLLERSDEESREMDGWTDLLCRYDVPSEMKIQIQRHIETTFLQKAADYEHDLVEKLPDDLKHRIQIEMYEDAIAAALGEFKKLTKEDKESICISGIREVIVGNGCKLYDKQKPVESIYVVTNGRFKLNDKEYQAYDIVGIEDAVSQSVAIEDCVPVSENHARLLKLPWKQVREVLRDTEILKTWEQARGRVLWANTITEIAGKIKIYKGAQELRAKIVGEVTTDGQRIRPYGQPPLAYESSGSLDLQAMDFEVESMTRRIREQEEEIKNLKEQLERKSDSDEEN